MTAASRIAIRDRRRLRMVFVALAAASLGLAAPTAQASSYLYVVNRSSNDISQYDATFGTLSPLSPATVAGGSAPSAVAVSPDGRNAYVARFSASAVAQYSIGADGTLHPKTPATVPAGSQPTAVAVSPDGRSVYVKNFFTSFSSSSSVSQYSVGADGRLTAKVPAQVAAGGGGGGDVVVSPDSQSVYVTNLPNDLGEFSISQYSADANGALTPKSPATVAVVGGPHDVAIRPDGQSVYVATCCNGIRQYSVGAGGTLTPKTPAFASGSGNAIAVSPDGQSAYAADFNVVFQYSIGADGTLSPKTPASVGSGNNNHDVVVSPDGSGVYVANATDVVRQFSIEAGGALAARSPAQVPAGSSPTALAITEGHSADPPTASITTPANGATYDIGDSVTTAFTCAPSLGGPAIVSCLDQDGDPPGQAIDTSAAGTFSLTVTATATDGQTGTRTSTYTVAQLNDDPVAQDVSVTTDEDQAVSFTIEVTDPDGDTTFSSEVTTSPAHGSATCGVLTCTYTPTADGNGSDSFVVRVSDGHGGADSATVSVAVTAVNDAPVAGFLAVSTDEGVDVGFTLPATDVDGDALTYDVVQPPPGRGSVTCDGAACAYRADPDYCCTITITFTVTDQDGATDDGAVQIAIAAVNDPPTATDQHVLIDEDTSLTFGLDVDDPDDAAALSATITDLPDHGEASCAGRVCTYTPAPNFFGEDAFTYIVTDPSGASASATVSFTVRAVNDPPVAVDQAVATDEDTNLAIELEATDPNGGELIINHGQPSHGGLSCTEDGCTYDPDTNYNGPDAFEFSVVDDHGATDTGRVDITVRPVNDAPVADDRGATAAEDTSVTFAITAADADGDGLAASVTGAPSQGGAACDGLSCTYTPAANYHGGDSFVVTVSDGHGGTDTAAVAVTVTPVNDPPTAQDVSVATDEDTAVDVALLGADIDADPLTYAVTGVGPQHGSVTCAGALCTYTPAADYHGPDSFTYRVTDPSGANASATVSIQVNSVMEATTLTAAPVIKLGSQPFVRLTVPFEARLVRTSSGAPLAGKTITFVAGGQPRCSAVTDADGVARCRWTGPSLLAVIAGLGYTAVFDGDTDYAGSSGTGALIA